MYKPSIAIVCTIRSPEPSIKTWIDYHLQHVDRILFYIDEPGSGDERLLSGIPGVELLAGDKNSWMLGPNGVMQRQDANAAHAIEHCRKIGIDWLFHIDSDELIWSRRAFLCDYLAGLPDEVASVTFRNHEVVGRFEPVADCFRELHLFKRNDPEFIHPDSGKLDWIFKKYGDFFYAYSNGKSAVRIAAAKAPIGPHRFGTTGGRLHEQRDEVAVLHYCSPTYAEWLKKYRLLGDFSDFWRDNRNTPIKFKFHLESRDAFLLARRTIDWTITERFFRSRVLEKEDVERLLNIGAVFWADPLEDIKRLGACRPAPSRPVRASSDTESRPAALPVVLDLGGRGMGKPAVALTATIREPGPSIRTWIDYHLQLVDCVLLYLDNPGPDDEALVSGIPGVIVLKGAKQEKPDGLTRIITAQDDNAKDALDHCRVLGVDWLLHIDCDELLWMKGKSLRTYLSGVPADTGGIRFSNDEVVSRFEETADCFKDMHLFKRNSARTQVDWVDQKYGQFFYGYTHGKSVVRVADALGPRSSHSFKLKSGKWFFEDDRVTVLHYICNSYEEWLRKYRRLGDFTNFWWDDKRSPIEYPFHVQSRDAFLLARRRLDWSIAERFFKSKLFVPEDIQRLLNTGAVYWADPLADLRSRAASPPAEIAG